MVGFLLFLAAIVAAIIWLISLYNKLIDLRNRFKNAFSQIDVHHVRYLIRALVWENGHAVLYETQRLLSWFDLPRQIRGQLRAAPHHETCYRIL